jgi:AcrR family transcriptional regulator
MSTPQHRRADPRVARTRLWLRTALIELIGEKEFDAITVSEIIQRAGINRSTFYKHYLDKWDLLANCVAETVGLLQRHVLSLEDPSVDSATTDAVPDVVVWVFEHIAEHTVFYRLMVGRHPLNLIAAELEQQVEQFIIQHAERFFPNGSAELLPTPLRCRIYAASFVGAVRWWLEHGQQYTPRQMATWTFRAVG